MKVRYIKEHLGTQAGSVIDLDEDRGRYLVMVGVAELIEPEKKEVTISTEKVERKQNHKPKKESK